MKRERCPSQHLAQESNWGIKHMSEEIVLGMRPSWTFRRLQPCAIAECNCLRDHKWEPPSSSEPLSPVHPQNCKSEINYGFKPLSFGLVCSAEIVEKLVPGCWALPKKQKQEPPKQGSRHENVPVDRSIYVKFKNRKDESVVIEVKRVESIFWREENFHILT